MANIQMGMNSHPNFFVDFIRADNGQPFVPTQPYTFVSSNESELNFAALIGNNGRVCNTGDAPVSGIQVTVTSADLPGESAVVLVDIIDNSEMGPVITAPPVVNGFRAGVN